MSRENSRFKSKSIGFIIISICVLIVLALVVSLLLATFTGFKKGNNEAVSVQTRELSTQIVYNYENYIDDIIDISTTIQSDIKLFNLNMADDVNSVSRYFSEINHIKSDVIKIAVYDYDQRKCLVSSDNSEIGNIIENNDLGWFLEAIGNPTVHIFSVPYSEQSGGYKVNISKRITLSDDSIGVLKIEISFQRIIELVSKSNLGDGGHITIIDPDYEIVYTSLGDHTSSLDEIIILRDIVLGAQNANILGYNMAINVDTLANTKWRICVFINVDKLVEIERDFLFTTIFVSFVVLAVGILLFTFVARAITEPMKRLELAMRKIEKSDYFRMEKVDIAASMEVEALIRRFNKMMLKIDELMKRVITEQNAQRKSELKALQNQINPHFLYNTLDSIIWTIENGKNNEAAEMTLALAKLFRIGISNDSEVIQVRNEIAHIKSYLLIQKIRYSDSFDYEFDIDEEALDAMTMKLVLQPIVENSIYHGLKNNIDRGSIKISAHIDNDYLILSVSDNGYGMRKEAIKALYDSFNDGIVSNSVGLKNIYQRVMIYYGGDAEMIIESELDVGTTISLKEPLIRNEK